MGFNPGERQPKAGELAPEVRLCGPLRPASACNPSVPRLGSALVQGTEKLLLAVTALKQLFTVVCNGRTSSKSLGGAVRFSLPEEHC